MENPAVKAINISDPPTLAPDASLAKCSWCPRKSLVGFRPSSSLLPLRSFYPKILSSKLIFIIRVYYHRSCSHTVARFLWLPADTLSRASSLAHSALLGALENFARYRASFVAAGRRRSDDD